MRIFNSIAVLIGVIGLILIIGAVGNQDLAVEMGIRRDLIEDTPQLIIGAILMVVSYLAYDIKEDLNNGTRKKF